MSEHQPISSDNTIPLPPFWGAKAIEQIPINAVVPYINKTSLYKFQWGFKPRGKSPQAYQEWARHAVDPIFNRLLAQAAQEEILRPQAVYGYFPCQSAGDTLIVYHDPQGERVRCQFTFPRQKTGRGLCLADFFRAQESGEIDVVAFQLITIGQHASNYARDLFQRDIYQEYLFWHGLNAEGAEGLAEFIHKRIRAELGFGAEDARDRHDLIKQKYRGSRYSFGYPACPNLHDQNKILELLNAERIHVTLGDEDQLWPEESTSAIIVHHPQAKYFST